MEMKLSEKELLYLAALTDTDCLWWGIGEPFKGMSEQELRLEMLSMQRSLLDKGCLVSVPEGETEIAEGCRELMSCCRKWEYIYILDSTKMEESSQRLAYIQSGDRVVRYCGDSSEVKLRFFGELMEAEVGSFFSGCDSEEQSCSLVTGVARLRRMGSLSRQRFLHELRACNCDEELAVLIADAMQGRPDFLSLLKYERTEGGARLCGKLVTMKFAGGSLMVTPGDDPEQTVCFTKLNRNKISAELSKIFMSRRETEVI